MQKLSQRGAAFLLELQQGSDASAASLREATEAASFFWSKVFQELQLSCRVQWTAGQARSARATGTRGLRAWIGQVYCASAERETFFMTMAHRASAFPLRHAWGRVLREAGAMALERQTLASVSLEAKAPPSDARAIELVAKYLPRSHSLSVACDATVVTPLRADDSARWLRGHEELRGHGGRRSD